MKNKPLLLVSALVSAAAHLLLIAAAYFVQIPAVKAVGAEALQTPTFKVESRELLREVKAESEPLEAGSRKKETYVQKILFEKPAQGLAEKIKQNLESDAALKAPDNLAAAPKALSLADFAPRVLPGGEGDLMSALKEQIALPRKTASQPSAISQPSIFVPRDALISETEFVQSPGTLPESLRGLPPRNLGSKRAGKPGGEDPLGLLAGAHAFAPEEGYQSLDRYLGVQLEVYRDPADGAGYYKISIYPFAEAKVLQVLPKEMIFLVDASLSIQSRRLYAFKEALKHALTRLNPDDLFNIYVFKSSITAFAPQSLRASREEISSAMEFLDELKPSQTTDIYGAFYETMRRPALRQPSYALLLSDGKPTDGVVSTTQLIAEITRENTPTRPIFAFSGGARVNRFFLDFLAYPNRGWSEYAASGSEIRERLMAFTDKIRNPVLTKVHYQLTPLDENEIYPKKLTDIYQDTFFTIYGRFRDEKRFSVRITGEAGSTDKEFIFSGDLSRAPEGSRDIARFWAFNKVYHLISKQVLGRSTEAEKKEIEDLIRRFGLEIPYRLDEL